MVVSILHMQFQDPRSKTIVAANPKGMAVSVLNTHKFVLDNVHCERIICGPSSFSAFDEGRDPDWYSPFCRCVFVDV